MKNVDFETFCKEAETILSNANSIVLATAYAAKVTARTMSHVNDGLEIMFQTGQNSEKALQMQKNPYVALAVSNLQIEALATMLGHPLNDCNIHFVNLYKQKFPKYFQLYSGSEHEVLFVCKPLKVTLYKYIDGVPLQVVIDIEKKSIRYNKT